MSVVICPDSDGCQGRSPHSLFCALSRHRFWSSLVRYQCSTAVWAVFLLSIPVAVFQPALAMYLWIAIWPVSAMLGRFQWKKFAAAQTLLYAQDS
ncbi:hypothetical protein [Arthrobacter sp. A5]|uniref:hypothetical protein n=1 Tax=Arthrobacter sp. A5 TaxID=576926 RepID=UPI003DA8639F